MSIELQLPQLYCRGNAFQVTAKDLTDDQNEEVSKLIDQMTRELFEDKNNFHRRLYNTIGSDYRDTNPYNASDADFAVAVWKASVHLLYHYKYELQCKACGATNYRGTTGKLIKITQRKTYCPTCGRCEISNPDQYLGYKNAKFTCLDEDNVTPSKLRRAFIHKDDYLALIGELADEGIPAPRVRSGIEAHKVSKFEPNHKKILADPDQRQRYFREFIYNYLQQTIKENKIKRQFKATQVDGCSDYVAYQMVRSYLCKNEIRHSVYDKHAGDDHWFIECDIYGVAPRFIPELSDIIHQTASWNVRIEFCSNGVKVYDQGTDVMYVDAEIKTREYVRIETSQKTTDGERTIDKIDTVEADMDDLGTLEQDDSWTTVRNGLRDDTKKVYEIISQKGPSYEEFVVQFGTGKPKKADMQRFLGVSAKGLADKYSEIRSQWLRMVPAN